MYSSVHPAPVDMGRLDNAIVVGRRVSAWRRPFLSLLPGQRFAQRAREYGNTVESVGAHAWKVQWDDGAFTVEKPAAVRAEAGAVQKGSRRAVIIEIWFNLLIHPPVAI